MLPDAATWCDILLHTTT